MKEKFLELLKQRPGLSFVELNQHMPESIGDFCFYICAKNGGKVLIWPKLSAEFIDMMVDLRKKEIIHLNPASVLVYLIDGALLDLPISKGKPRKNAVQDEWLPSTIHLGPHPTHINGEKRKAKK